MVLRRVTSQRTGHAGQREGNNARDARSAKAAVSCVLLYTSDDWQSFVSEPMAWWYSMCRRGDCNDNAPVESCFGLLKRERIKRRIYPTKDAARTDGVAGTQC